jgi:hypothetical protein
MLERIINWRARVNGVRWFTGEQQEAPAIEQGGDTLTGEEKEYLAFLEGSMAGPPVCPGVSAERWAEVGITHPAPVRRPNLLVRLYHWLHGQ